MKPALRLFAFVLIVGFAAMTVAAVLPHSHTSNQAHHLCWLCQSKAIHVAEPEASLEAVPSSLGFVAPVQNDEFWLIQQFDRLPQEARAPPVFLVR